MRAGAQLGVGLDLVQQGQLIESDAGSFAVAK